MKALPPIITPENFSYPCGEYRVFRITPTDSDSMQFLPKLHVRALEFIEKYRAETDPVFLTGLLYNNLRNPETANLVHVLVAIDPYGEIVGHMLSYVDSYQKLGPVIIQMQTEKDKGLDRDIFFDTFRGLVIEWARSLKIKTILTYALSPALARLNERGGFKFFRTVQRYDVD